MATTTWTIDNMHSEVQFKVKHLVISTVTGLFRDFEGSLVTENGNFNGAKASFKLNVASIDTNVADRDAHLKSADFFDAENYPTVDFDGTLNQSGDGFKLEGNLTIKAITKPVTLNVEYGGSMVDGYGNNKAGFEVVGTINRKEFGLTWSMVTEAGGVVVGDDVKLALNIQLAEVKA